VYSMSQNLVDDGSEQYNIVYMIIYFLYIFVSRILVHVAEMLLYA
jgi:hypothetical protein